MSVHPTTEEQSFPDNFVVIPKDYHKWRWRGMAIWCVVFTLIVGYSVNQNHELAVTTNDALCKFRDDLDVRHATTQEYLDGHPDEEFLFGGVPRTTLETTLRNQSATLLSLSSLECPPSTVPPISVEALFR